MKIKISNRSSRKLIALINLIKVLVASIILEKPDQIKSKRINTINFQLKNRANIVRLIGKCHPISERQQPAKKITIHEFKY